MAQTIKHRRGSISSVRNITSFGEAEIVIGSGSVDSKVTGPVVYIGKPGGTTAANDYVPVGKMYVGSGVPSITPAQYGTTLDGLPYYDTTNKTLYILGANADGTSGHTQINITTSSIDSFDSHVSASAAASGFGAGSGGGIFELVSGTIYQSDGKNLQISGSGGKYALEVSESINAYNINAGVPTSNDWQTNLDGSYFNNFTKDTDVSEILRFVAGLLSSSAANPTPNTKTYNSISENKTNTSTSAAPSGYIPNDNDINDLTYLIDKGWASVGGTLFPGKTIYTNTGYSISYTSVAGGSTSQQSSVDSQLFGLGALSSGAGAEFRVSGSHSFTFSDNSSDTTTETSASGNYTISTTIGIATGSQSDYTDKTASETIFWAPVSTINSNIGDNSLASSGEVVTALTLTSGSMSGAPFINGGTWNLVATASGVFEPMYASSTTLVDVSIGSTSGYTISNTSGKDTLSTNGGTIQTTGMVTDAAGTTARNSGVPHRTDLVEIDATYTISGTGNTFNESGFSDTSYTLTTTARDRAATQSTLDTKTVNLHSAGTFGQPAASGSMGYHGGGSTTTTLIEYFTSESYRRTISDSTTLDTVWDESARVTLGDGGDLQVKPGYLVNQESANGYWYPTGGYNAAHYKWYLREFDTAASNNKGTLTIDLNPNTSADLTTFDDTTTGKIAVGVIFGSTASTVFDAVKGTTSYGGSLNSQSANGSTNPFSDTIDVKSDFDSLTNSSGTLTLGLANAAGQTINATHDKVWVLIRYTGTPSYTLERITVSVS